MTEFNAAITAEQATFLHANREELYKTDGGKAIWQNRVKMAGEAFKIAKTTNDESTVSSLDITNGDDEAGEVDYTFPTWQVYRDNFILDWIANRTIVTEEEAEMIFERDVNDALSVIEAGEVGGSTDVELGTEITTAVTGAPEAAREVQAQARERAVDNGDGTPAPKRGRPAGKVKAVKVKKVVKLQKVAAAKKGKSTSERAAEIIAWGQSRHWARKDILERLTTQIDGLGAPYAATLYQKHAS